MNDIERYDFWNRELQTFLKEIKKKKEKELIESGTSVVELQYNGEKVKDKTDAHKINA